LLAAYFEGEEEISGILEALLDLPVVADLSPAELAALELPLGLSRLLALSMALTREASSTPSAPSQAAQVSNTGTTISLFK
jgi:hypothetical protein